MTMRISVVTVVRNGAATIRDCLDSVQRQTVRAEHVVWDGGSTDGTDELVRRSPDVHLHQGADAGIYDAMNKGIALATGDVVGTLNADDAYADETCLERVAEALGRSGADSCYGDLVYVDAKDPSRVRRTWRSGAYSPESFYWGWMPPHPTFFVRRGVYERFGAFDTGLGTASDYELMLRLLLRHGISSVYIPQVLVRMRMGGASNASLLGRLRANRMDRRAWRVNGLKAYPWTTVAKPLRKVGQFL
jgi:glycosyltransferase